MAYHLGYLKGGFLGVDVFFVLSGFLVTGLAIGEFTTTEDIDVRAFWGRRMRRLAPALLVMVPITVVAALAIGWPGTERESLAIDGFATLTWWENWRQILAPGGGYWSDVPSLFRHAWSLSIEEQFYLLWPLVLAGVAVAVRYRPHHLRRGIGIVAAVLAIASTVWALVLAHRLPAEDLSRVYLGSDTRALAPLLGCLAAALFWGRRQPRIMAIVGALAVVALGIFMATVGVSSPTTYRAGLLPISAVLAVLAILGATRLNRNDPVTRWLGQRSYGLYLWSWPIQVLIQLQWPSAGRTAVATLTVPLSLLAAEASYRLVERPIQLRAGWARQPALRRAAGASAVAIALTVLLVSWFTATEKPIHETMDSNDAIEAALKPPTTLPPTSAPPADGPPLPESVMVLGDSVAFTATLHAPEPPVTEGVALLDGRSVIGCGLLAADGWLWPSDQGGWDEPAKGACLRVDEAIDIGLSASPDVVLVIPGAWEGTALRSPGGEIVEAQSPRMSQLISGRLNALADRASLAGARTVLVPWACPGPGDEPERRDPAYLRWFQSTLEGAVADREALGLTDMSLAELPPGVCETTDPTSAPTAEKNAAMDNEVHVSTPEGAKWIWDTWFGPSVTSTRPD